MRRPLAGGVLIAALMAAAVAGAEPSTGASGGDAYRIGPEDTLQIAVWRNEAISKTVPVRPDGMISLPLINDVPAAGLTPLEIRELVRTKLADFIEAPEVSKPARYELKSGATVLDVLALAGGLSEFAARGRIVILRPNGGPTKRLLFNYNKATAAGGENENVPLHPGDIVLVP